MRAFASRATAGVSTPLPAVGLVARYAADAITNITDGQSVTNWNDTTGLAAPLLVGVGLTPPTFLANADGDSMPLVRFDGVLNQLQNLDASLAYGGTDFTAYFVARNTYSSGAKKKMWALCGAGGDEFGNGSMYFGVDIPDAWRLRYNYPGNGSAYCANARATQGPGNFNQNTGVPQWALGVIRFSTVLGYGWTHVRCGQIAGDWTLGAAAPMTFTEFYLGSGSTNGVAWPNTIQCDVREFGMYHRALLDSEIRALMRYAGNKWQLPGLI